MSEQAATMPERQTIADILVAHGFVDEEQIRVALDASSRTGQPVGQWLVNEGAITRLELASALAEQWSAPSAAFAAPLAGATSIPALELVPTPRRENAPETAADGRYLAQLHEAISDLARRVGAAEPLLEEVERRAAESAAADSVATLEARLEGLDEQIASFVARMTTAEAAVVTATDGLDTLTLDAEEAVGTLQVGMGELGERLGALSAVVGSAATHEDVEAVQADVKALTDALSDLRETVAGAAQEADAHPDLAAKLEALEELTTRLGSSSEADYGNVATKLEALEEVVAALAARPQEDSGVAARVDGLTAQVESLAAIAASGDDRLEIDELREALEELGRRRAADEGGATAVSAVAAEVERLGDRLAAADASLSAFGAQIDDLAGRFESDAEELADVRALAVSAAQPPDNSELERVLGALGARIDELSAASATQSVAPADGERLDAIETSIRLLYDDLAATAASTDERIEVLERIPAKAPALPPEPDESGWSVAAESLEHRLDGVSERLDGLAALLAAETRAGADSQAGQATPPATRSGPAAPADETEQELERLRMAIERMGLNLGEQERAIAEVLRSPGVTGRLDELEARIDDVAAGSVPATGEGPSSGGAPAASNVEVRTLARRLDSAEAALDAERDKLLTKLERIASALDWRMRRLEAEDVEGV